MSVTSSASGNQSATIGTEHVLADKTAAGVYTLAVDLSNMANGDITELRLYTKANSNGSLNLAYICVFCNAQNEPNVYSIPVPVDTEIKATLKQTAGTGRSYQWNLLVM
jgi:hypothetical protein